MKTVISLRPYEEESYRYRWGQEDLLNSSLSNISLRFKSNIFSLCICSTSSLERQKGQKVSMYFLPFLCFICLGLSCPFLGNSKEPEFLIMKKTLLIINFFFSPRWTTCSHLWVSEAMCHKLLELKAAFTAVWKKIHCCLKKNSFIILPSALGETGTTVTAREHKTRKGQEKKNKKRGKYSLSRVGVYCECHAGSRTPLEVCFVINAMLIVSCNFS